MHQTTTSNQWWPFFTFMRLYLVYTFRINVTFKLCIDRDRKFFKYINFLSRPSLQSFRWSFIFDILKKKWDWWGKIADFLENAQQSPNPLPKLKNVISHFIGLYSQNYKRFDRTSFLRMCFEDHYHMHIRGRRLWLVAIDISAKNTFEYKPSPYYRL